MSQLISLLYIIMNLKNEHFIREKDISQNWAVITLSFKNLQDYNNGL